MYGIRGKGVSLVDFLKRPLESAMHTSNHKVKTGCTAYFGLFFCLRSNNSGDRFTPVQGIVP